MSKVTKTSAVGYSLFDLPAIASRSGEAGGYSIFMAGLTYSVLHKQRMIFKF